MSETATIQQYRDFADAVIRLGGVQSADVHKHDPRLGRPSVEITIGPGYMRVPPRVHGVIRDYDLGHRPGLSQERAEPRCFVLVVT